MNNKLGYPSMLAVCAVLVGASLPACAQVCTTTFTDSQGDHDWNTLSNWTLGLRPTATDVVCIQAGKLALIQTSGPDGVCKALIVNRVGSSRGVVNILVNKSLTIFGDAITPVNSIVDGDLVLGDNTRLKLGNDLTIKGSGGRIRGNPYSVNAKIESTDATLRTLTLEGASTTNRGKSLVADLGLVFDVALVNKAFVVANWGNTEINEGGSGNGNWVAERYPFNGQYGILHVNTAITGSGSWLIQTHDEAEIQINAACTALSGDFAMTDGVFNVNANFTTTGDLDVMGARTVESTINIAAGATATFHATP